jgi:DNA-binding PadR family transcriptional regulator
MQYRITQVMGIWNNMWDKLKDLHKDYHERIDEMQNLGGLRIWIIHVLDEQGPKNGVELMDAVQSHYIGLNKPGHKRHRHSKRPSPGSLYPMLKKMVDEKLIKKMEDGRYELTNKGQEKSYKIFRHFHGKHSNLGISAIENTLKEMDNNIAYLENLKKEKLVKHEELIVNLNTRLKLIKESLHEE